MLNFLAQHSIRAEIPSISPLRQQELGLKVVNGAIATLKKAKETDNPCSWLLALARCDILGYSSKVLASKMGDGMASNTITELEGGMVNLNKFSHPVSKLIRYFKIRSQDGILEKSRSQELTKITAALLDLTEEKYAQSAPTMALLTRWRYEFGAELLQKVTGIGNSNLSQMSLSSIVLQPHDLLRFAKKLGAIDPKATTAQVLEHPCYIKICEAYKSHALLFARPEPIITLENKLAICNSRISSKGIEGELNISLNSIESRKLLAYGMIPFIGIQPVVLALRKMEIIQEPEIISLRKKWKSSLAVQPPSVGQELSLRAKELRLENRNLAMLIGIDWKSKEDTKLIRDVLVREGRSLAVPVGSLIFLLARDETDLKGLQAEFFKQEDSEARRRFSTVRTSLYKELKLWNLSAPDLGVKPEDLAILALTKLGPLEKSYFEILGRARELGSAKAKTSLLNWFQKFNSSNYLEYLNLASERVSKGQLCSAAHIAPNRLRNFLAQTEIPSLPEFVKLLSVAAIPLLPEALMSWHQTIARHLVKNCANELERILRAYLLEIGETATVHQKNKGWIPGHKSPFRQFFSEGVISIQDFANWIGSSSDLPWTDLALRESPEPQLIKLYQSASWRTSHPLLFISDQLVVKELQKIVSGRNLENLSLDVLFRLKTRVLQVYNHTASADHPTFKRLDRVEKLVKSFPGMQAEEIIEFAKLLAPVVL